VHRFKPKCAIEALQGGHSSLQRARGQIRNTSYHKYQSWNGVFGKNARSGLSGPNQKKKDPIPGDRPSTNMIGQCSGGEHFL